MASKGISDGPFGPRDGARLILVVEDEMLVRMLACDILTEAGYHPIEAVNAEEAATLLDARPDIVVLFSDVDMPGAINGLGLARLAAMKFPALPIIVTTGPYNSSQPTCRAGRGSWPSPVGSHREMTATAP